MSCPNHLVECPACQRALVAKATPKAIAAPSSSSSSYSSESSYTPEPRESLADRCDQIQRDDAGGTRGLLAKHMKDILNRS